MDDLLTLPAIDKHGLVGGCVRLPLAVDAGLLAPEVDALPADLWGSAAGRVGVHSAAEALFLRGYAPAEGPRPIEDRPLLASLPYVRSIIEDLIPARPLRALLARLPAGAMIRPHVDAGAYFARSLRVHVPVATNERVWMLCAGDAYRLAPGEVWLLNNGAEHGVWNNHPTLPRTHLICDFLPEPPLLELLERGERGLGIPIAEAEAIERARPTE